MPLGKVNAGVPGTTLNDMPSDHAELPEALMALTYQYLLTAEREPAETVHVPPVQLGVYEVPVPSHIAYDVAPDTSGQVYVIGFETQPLGDVGVGVPGGLPGAHAYRAFEFHPLLQSLTYQ